MKKESIILFEHKTPLDLCDLNQKVHLINSSIVAVKNFDFYINNNTSEGKIATNEPLLLHKTIILKKLIYSYNKNIDCSDLDMLFIDDVKLKTATTKEICKRILDRVNSLFKNDIYVYPKNSYIIIQGIKKIYCNRFLRFLYKIIKWKIFDTEESYYHIFARAQICVGGKE